MKYHFHRDTLLATVFLFFMLWLLSVIIKTLEPGKIEPKDFDYTDMVYSEGEPNKTRLDPNIVIVNVGDTDRAGIAAILEKVNTMHPSVIGMDLLFHKHKDVTADSLLAAAISATPNLVMCSEISMVEEKHTGYFAPYSRHNGFGNFYGEQGNVIRYFKPFHKEDTSFAAAILHIANPEAFNKLSKQDKDVLAINYTRRDTELLVVNYNSLLNDYVDENAIKNKIVLIGLYTNNKYNIEDKHITPMNPVLFGRSLPDMHGVAIHANILSMMLKDNYIPLTSKWFNYLLAVILAWICNGLFIKDIVNKHIWFHIVVKVWQFIALGILVTINIILFKYGHVKTDLSLAIAVLIFSAEILYVYEIFAMWLARRFNHKTIFKQH